MSPETIKSLPHSMIYLAVCDAGGFCIGGYFLIRVNLRAIIPVEDRTQCSIEMLPKQGGISMQNQEPE